MVTVVFTARGLEIPGKRKMTTKALTKEESRFLIWILNRETGPMATEKNLDYFTIEHIISLLDKIEDLSEKGRVLAANIKSKLETRPLFLRPK